MRLRHRGLGQVRDVGADVRENGTRTGGVLVRPARPICEYDHEES